MLLMQDRVLGETVGDTYILCECEGLYGYIVNDSEIL